MDKAEAQRVEFARRTQLFKDYLRSDDYQERLLERLKITDACNISAEARALMWNQCARPDNPAEGCIFFMETFGFTYDSRTEHHPNHLPFILFDYQKDTVRWLMDCIDTGKDVPFHIQKVEEDVNNTGVIIIHPSGISLEEWEVGYK